MKSKIEAIAKLKGVMPLSEAKEFVEAVMELGAEDWKTRELVKVQLDLITKLGSEGYFARTVTAKLTLGHRKTENAESSKG